MAANARLVPCNIWSWPQIANLLLEQKAIFAFSFANRYANSCGTYDLPIRAAAAELSISEEALREAIADFTRRGLFDFDAATGEILVVAWCRFNTFKGVGVKIFWGDVQKIQSPRLRARTEELALLNGIPLAAVDKPADKKANPDESKTSLPTAASAATSDFLLLLQEPAKNSQGKVRDERPSGIVTWLPDDISKAERIEREHHPDDIRLACRELTKDGKTPVPGLVQGWLSAA